MSTGIDREHQAYVDGLREQLRELKEAHKAALERGRAEYARRVKAENGLAELLEAAKELVADGECYCADNVASREPCGWCKASIAIAKATNPNADVTQPFPKGRYS